MFPPDADLQTKSRGPNAMNHTLTKLSLLGLLAATPTISGCATIAGTAASPITGGVNLCARTLSSDQWYWSPFVFLGGAAGGPFIAIYKGLLYDAQSLSATPAVYWHKFGRIFRPWDLVL